MEKNEGMGKETWKTMREWEKKGGGDGKGKRKGEGEKKKGRKKKFRKKAMKKRQKNRRGRRAERRGKDCEENAGKGQEQKAADTKATTSHNKEARQLREAFRTKMLRHQQEKHN